MRISDMQERRIGDEEIARHLEDMVSIHGPGVLKLIEERARWTASLGGPLYAENALRVAEAAQKKMQKV